jgi:hypothetical protein
MVSRCPQSREVIFEEKKDNTFVGEVAEWFACNDARPKR